MLNNNAKSQGRNKKLSLIILSSFENVITSGQEHPREKEKERGERQKDPVMSLSRLLSSPAEISLNKVDIYETCKMSDAGESGCEMEETVSLKTRSRGKNVFQMNDLVLKRN